MLNMTRLPLLTLLVIALPVLCKAADLPLNIIKVQGAANIYNEQGALREPAKPGAILQPGDTIRTEADGNVALRSKLGDTYVLDGNAAAQVQNSKSVLKHILGRIGYFFEHIPRVERRVEVYTAVIGIRGTTFLVNASPDQTSIGLKEGALDVSSTQDGFNVYQRKELDEFEAFKQQNRQGVEDMKKEYEQYRNKMREEFIAFKKSVQIKSHQSLTLSGNKAVIGTIDDDSIDTLRRLQQFIPSGNGHP